MIKIILYGDLEDRLISKLLIDMLEGKINITYVTPVMVRSYTLKDINKNNNDFFIDRRDDILIIETDRIDVVESSDTIIIFKNSIAGEIQINVGRNTLFVLSSENIKAIDFLRNIGNKNVITCGYHLTDTVTVSSCDDEKKSVSLLREIKTIYGNIIDPFEVPIKSLMSISTILPVYTVLMLIDKSEIIK